MSAQTTREWKLQNKERVSRVEKERYLRKRDEIKAKNKAYYERCKTNDKRPLGNGGWRKYHSDEERLLGKRRRQRNAQSARRARERDQFIEKIDAMVVYEVHGGICSICGDSVLRSDFHVDHVVPLSRGGLHCYDNVQVAHPKCNMKKHNALQGGDNQNARTDS